MKSFKWYIGHNVNGKKMWAFHEVEQRVQAIMYDECLDATIYDARGTWEGKAENVSVVEVLTDMDSKRAVTIAKRFREMFRQEAVLWTASDVEMGVV